MDETGVAKSAEATFKWGMLQASTDSSSILSDATIDYVGHTFGRLGQGKRSMPFKDQANNIRNSAFRWQDSGISASHGMYVSILPYTTSTGLTSGQEIVIEAYSVDFEALATFDPPAYPTASSEIPAGLGAFNAYRNMVTVILASTILSAGYI